MHHNRTIFAHTTPDVSKSYTAISAFQQELKMHIEYSNYKHLTTMFSNLKMHSLRQ